MTCQTSLRRTFFILACSLSFAGTSPLHAGVEIHSSIDRARNFENSRSPDPIRDGPGFSLLTGDVAPSSPGDQDLGEQWLLKYKEKERPFMLVGDFAGFATNNVALTKNGTQRDQFIVGQIAASYQPKLTSQLLAEFTFRQAFFRYRRFTELDFDSQNMGAGLTYLPAGLWNIAFYGRYNYNRLLDAREENEIFTNHSLTLGLQKAFVLSRAHYFYAGYASQLGIAHPRASERDEHGAYAGYHLNVTRALQGDFFYRLAWFDYAKGGRDDLNQTVSSSLQFYFTKWLYAYASASLVFNNSNKAFLDYNAFSPAVGLNATLKF